MKKILNLTRNETEDIVSVTEEEGVFPRISPDGMTIRGRSVTYTLAKERHDWKAEDEYKIIEV